MAQKFVDEDYDDFAGGVQCDECIENCESPCETQCGECFPSEMCTHVGFSCSATRSNRSNSPADDSMDLECCGAWKANDVVDADQQCLDWRDHDGTYENEEDDFRFAIVQDDVDDVDSPRASIVEPDDHYSEEYYQLNLVLEAKCPKDPLVNQPQVRCCDRAILMAWLSKVIRSLDLLPETLFLTANIIDRFLVCTPIALECLQLLGLSAMFVAAKQLEISHPSVKELVELGADVYSRRHFLQMERIILKRLQFNLVVATSLFFVEYYITYQSTSSSKGRSCSRSSVSLLERPHRVMVRNLAELSVQNYDLCRYAPSVVALSSMAVVEEYVSGRPVDLSDCRYASWSHELSLLKQCTADIWSHLARVLPGSGSMRAMASDKFFECFQPPRDVT